MQDQDTFVAYLKERCRKYMLNQIGQDLDPASITHKETIMIKNGEIRGVDVTANARNYDGTRKARCNFMIQIRFTDLLKSKNIRRDP